jgi:hypothetical protein
MTHAFQTIPAKHAFGTLRGNLSQSDYINRIKGKQTYCNSPSYCQKLITSSSYENKYLFYLGRYSLGLETCNILPVNKSNLIMGQYTSMNLNNVCEAINQPPPNTLIDCNSTNYESCTTCDTPINMNVNPTTGQWNSGNTKFYQDIYIDPIGELFGNTQCGELNYTQLMVFNPPTVPNGITLGFS